MVGGGNRRDGGSYTVGNTNVFAALESLRKKKKSDKEKSSYKAEKQVYWAPAPLTVKSWADVDDEEEDNYYATTAPPQAVWGGSGLTKQQVSHKAEHLEESESEDEQLVESDDNVEEEEELDHENEIQEPPVPIAKKPAEASSAAPKEAERQLSKKERRKKELAELEAILANFGVNSTEKSEDDQTSNAAKLGNEGLSNGEAEKNNTAPVEPKNAKKKKKKVKASKEVKDSQDQSKSSGVPNEQDGTSGPELTAEDTSGVDVMERLKKATYAKKKKSNKEMDGAARAAAVEAAARSAKLAAAKKKVKNHYNQQPIR